LRAKPLGGVSGRALHYWLTTSQTARIRDTLRMFLDVQGSYIDTAFYIHARRCMDFYRLRTADGTSGHRVHENREIHVAPA
jgi:hypothetical protein